jgi:hypothetical protein
MIRQKGITITLSPGALAGRPVVISLQVRRPVLLPEHGVRGGDVH